MSKNGKYPCNVNVRASHEQVAAWKLAAGHEPLGHWVRRMLNSILAASSGQRGEPGTSPETAPRGGALSATISAGATGPQLGGETAGNKQNEKG